MKRIAGGLALAAGLFAAAPAALANDAGSGEGKTEMERRLEEVLAELEAQRVEINTLRSQLEAVQDPAGLQAAINAYLASEDGKAATGRDEDEFKVFWKDGLNFQTDDRKFHLKVGGRAMWDMVFPDADDDIEAAAGDFSPLSGFRRLRIEMEGTIYDTIFYKNVLDFSGTGYAYKDNLIGAKNLPGVGNFQVGLFKEPVGLEELTSSKYISFAERSIVTNAFAPAHNHGAMIFNDYDWNQLTWAIGDFWDGGTGTARIQHGWSARVTAAPWVDEENHALLHVGASAQLHSPESETDRFRVRPETPFTPRTLDTGTLSVESERIVGLEAAFVRGPFWVQAEYYQAAIDGHGHVAGSPDPDFRGWYVAASWFLTGESKPYKKGSFGRVKPKSNYDGKDGSGTGAVEFAVRYARLDLDDDGVQGGTGDDITLGVNWYLNPSTRIMLNYVTHHVRYNSDLDGDVNSVVVRFQVDF